MRNSFLKAVTSSFAGVALIVSLGTSPTLARDGGGHGGGGGMAFRGGSGFHEGVGFHSSVGFHPYSGFHSHSHFFGGYNACVNAYNQPGNPTYPANYSCW